MATLSITHSTVTAITDNPPAGGVGNTAWNAGHILAGILPIANGGLNVATVPATGAIPIGDGTNYVVTPIAAGTNITITNGPGSITIASTASGGGTNEFFGTGGDGAITDNAGGTIIRNGILNATTYALATSVATTLTHDVSRAAHIKASTGISMGATSLVFGNSKGGVGGVGGATFGFTVGNGGPGVHGGGGGGGATLGASGSRVLAIGGRGGGLAGGTGGTSVVSDEVPNTFGTPRGGLAGQTVQFVTDVGYGGRLAGPGGGGGGGAGGDVTAGKTGGAGGGYFVFEAVAITLTAGFAYRATGAAGTAGTAEEGAGGGGAGGTFIQMRRTLTGTMSVTVTGGAGGGVGGTGGGGGAGAAGQFIDEVLV